ncbi:hypothetical protein [Actinomadura geliboluensis]|uniref:Uncharacterized protein n=1 Tax=Actinomadura geliboluensis TaxID=882440 RepID=A0A5S4FV08_9ACTN|nr:hypothetical protein [Actinomadura geliboluensis]TMR24605.1 hypothetical protein ETD96_43025 [Actinomadura geliboluensis]
MPPPDAPGGIIDLWEPTAVHQLTDRHTVCVFGAELRVQDCRPAERGGDFYVLEAVNEEERPPRGKPAGAMIVEVDRNRLVNARLDTADTTHR